MHSTSFRLPPKSRACFSIIFLATFSFSVTLCCPFGRPITFPFNRAVSIPSLVRWRKSSTSFWATRKVMFHSNNYCCCVFPENISDLAFNILFWRGYTCISIYHIVPPVSIKRYGLVYFIFDASASTNANICSLNFVSLKRSFSVYFICYNI